MGGVKLALVVETSFVITTAGVKKSKLFYCGRYFEG